MSSGCRRGPALSLFAAAAFLFPVGCEQTAKLEGKGCPCLVEAGYVCCETQNACLPRGQICVDPKVWPVATTPTAPLPLDDVTVYAFSQVDTGGNVDIADQQLLDLAPDMVIRGWGQWGSYGTRAADYQFEYVRRCHQAGIRYFMGGAATTVLLAGQLLSNATSEDPQNLTARNAENRPLPRIDADMNKIYRGSLANPAYREMVVSFGKLQIDGDGMGNNGVDGLHFEEINGGYQGANAQMVADGNEGFDDFHLADFNAYLLAKHPPGTSFAALFGMTPDNILRRETSPGDFAHSFDYRRYLFAHGWSSTPLIDANPLAREWGQTAVNRPRPGALTFVDSAEPYYYWKEIVDKLRTYARSTNGRELLITAEGVYPFVDFQSVGLDDHNKDGPDGATVDYLPTTEVDGIARLDGRQSLQAPFRHLKALSEQFAPGVPVVLFLDGPWRVYDKFPDSGSDRQDFWRLYAAEAYANGLFFAFHLKSSVGQKEAEPTASKLGLMPLFKSLATFYRGHASYYHGGSPAPEGATALVPALPGAMVTLTDQLAPADSGGQRKLVRRLAHVVNHDYRPGTGIVHQTNVVVSISSPIRPVEVSLASPDFSGGDLTVGEFSYADGQAVVTIPGLDAYVVVILSY
ncbi:MAG: hypothetical protein ABJA82_01110 [Myxococcales bacterium]